MNIYHSYFKFWRNFERKQDFCWIAITKSVPLDYVGNIYRLLAPIGKNFEMVENPFNEKLFFIEYFKLLKSLDKGSVIKDLEGFSKKGKDIVILNWEDLTRKSEGRFAYAWLFNLRMEEVNQFDLEHVLRMKKIKDEIVGDEFLNL